MKKIMLVLAVLLGLMAVPGMASATTHPEKCYDTVVDQPAYDETVTVTEAYDEKVIDTPAQPAVEGKWWNFSPNHKQGPLDGAPSFPTDARGTWQGPHTNGGPAGEGTYQSGGGHGSWFHREAGTPAVAEVSHVVHHDAVTKVVHHEATTKQVEVPCNTPEEPTTTEITVCWQQENPDGLEATYGWPQHKAAGTLGDCNPVPECEETIEVQVDKYTVTEAQLADVKAATTISGPADDAAWNPHDYYNKVIVGDDCVTPPVDVCPDVEGNQPEGTDCNPVVPPVDVCPEVEGDQPEGTDCNPVIPPVEPPVTDTPDKPKPEIGTPISVKKVSTPVATGVLPNTGGESINWVYLGLGMLLIGGTAIAIGKPKRQA